MPNYFTMNAGDGNFMVINGVRYPICMSEVEYEEPNDPLDRKRWAIVTEGQEEA